MQVGQLRHLVELQNYSTTVNSDYGEPVKNWTKIAYAWANIKPVSGQVKEQGNRETASVTHSIVIRYNADLDENCRIKWEDRIFEIIAVQNYQERNIFMIVTAQEQK